MEIANRHKIIKSRLSFTRLKLGPSVMLSNKSKQVCLGEESNIQTPCNRSAWADQWHNCRDYVFHLVELFFQGYPAAQHFVFRVCDSFFWRQAHCIVATVALQRHPGADGVSRQSYKIGLRLNLSQSAIQHRERRAPHPHRAQLRIEPCCHCSCECLAEDTWESQRCLSLVFLWPSSHSFLISPGTASQMRRGQEYEPT